MALSAELEPLGDTIPSIFSTYLLNTVDTDLYNVDVCLTRAHDAYLASSSSTGGRVALGAKELAGCRQHGVNWSVIRVCIQDILIQIDDAENRSEHVNEYNETQITQAGNDYRRILSSDESCGPMRRDSE